MLAHSQMFVCAYSCSPVQLDDLPATQGNAIVSPGNAEAQELLS